MTPFMVAYYEFSCNPNGEGTRTVFTCCVDAETLADARTKALGMKPAVEARENSKGCEMEVFTIAEWCYVQRRQTEELEEYAEIEEKSEEAKGYSLGEDTGHSQ